MLHISSQPEDEHQNQVGERMAEFPTTARYKLFSDPIWKQ